jgi:hypothetical protein
MMVHVDGSDHTGYWNQRAQTGSEFECEGVTSRERMEEVPRMAGWNMERVSSLDWKRDEAVVVASSKYYKYGLLSFNGLTREGNTIVLAYGSKPAQASESVGANSASFGSVGEGYWSDYILGIVPSVLKRTSLTSRFFPRTVTFLWAPFDLTSWRPIFALLLAIGLLVGLRLRTYPCAWSHSDQIGRCTSHTRRRSRTSPWSFPRAEGSSSFGAT